MSFLAATYDISKLPKVRTHAQLGRMGWTSSDVTGAEQELVAAHQWLIDFANAMASIRDEAITIGAPQEMINGFADSLETQKSLVQQHTAIMNDFYAKTGAGVAGLLGRTSLKGLGQWQIALIELAPLLGILARQLYWVYLTYIVGEGVQALKTNAEAAKTEAISRVDCYKLWREAMQAGTTPPDCSPNRPTDWTTVALIGGSVILAMMLFGRRR